MIITTIKRQILIFFLFMQIPLWSNARPDTVLVDTQDRVRIEWDNSLSLPDVDHSPNKGLAGVFSGFIGNSLIITGGANFPDALPWEGGTKEWWNTLYYLDTENPSAGWKIKEDFLPRKLAYGVSVELPDGVLCIGGCDQDECSREVFLIGMENGQPYISDEWPSLPVPLANATGALLDNKIVVAGGQESMKEQQATGHFFMLDLSDRKKGWQRLESWPGEPRGYAVGAVQSDGSDNCFYLFSGRDYYSDGYIKVLTDGYVFNPKLKSWKKLEGNFPVMAGTALATGTCQILLMGGVPLLIPGSADHPGFDNTVRVYDTRTKTLTGKELSPYAIPVTTTIAGKGNTFYITSGEIKPGIRTPAILKGELP